VVGTSLFQIIFVTAFTTLMHAITSQTVDIMLAALLIVGGVIGAQLGTVFGTKLRGEQLRILLAMMVLAVSFKIALDLLLQPSELYSITAGALP
nr:sulfite exporter TauE/SafE family protein [Cypionkella sp.]